MKWNVNFSKITKLIGQKSKWLRLLFIHDLAKDWKSQLIQWLNIAVYTLSFVKVTEDLSFSLHSTILKIFRQNVDFPEIGRYMYAKKLSPALIVDMTLTAHKSWSSSKWCKVEHKNVSSSFRLVLRMRKAQMQCLNAEKRKWWAQMLSANANDSAKCASKQP